ncbi:MAG TPA: class I SAM-dependent methyltransferase [Roseiflexaceae bacterium]|nr:class I SAM-dependent methyltransferase [Roseiflexaceae bacterium]
MSDFDAFARFYDADYGRFEEDVPFYRELARRCGGPVVELMCGTGRLLAPLARAGHRLTGIDIAPALLARARDRLVREGLLERVELLAGDVRDPLPGGPYALAIVGLNSLMHLEETDDQLLALRSVAAALRPGGLLALDLFNPDPRELLRHNGELVLDKTFALEGGATVQKFVAQSTDLARQMVEVSFIYDLLESDGLVRRTVLPFRMRWLYRYELEHLLARAGFALEAVYGSYDLDEYDSASPLMLTVARRSAD